MPGRLLTVVVVGHTNTGKTSLLRTLARDSRFGEVSDQPATTRSVEGIELLFADGKPALMLMDSPGLEDPVGLLDALDSNPDADRFNGPERVRQFLATPAATTLFEQEAKVLRQMLVADAGIYVIDCRERVLGKYREELSLLAYCAVPILPVLNFVHGPVTHEQEWREQLARLNLHAMVAFDTVVYDEVGERRLFEKLRTLLDAHAGTLEQLLTERRKQAEWLRRAAAEILAELLIDTAACLRSVPGNLETETMRDRVLTYQEEVRAREQRAVDALLRLFRFADLAYEEQNLPLVNGAWGMDLFNPDALKHYGLRMGGGAAAGAATGAALDVATLGLTLGMGTLGGAALGAVLGTSIPLHRRLFNKFQGQAEWRVADDTLRILAGRQMALIQMLLRRGHAAQAPLPAITSGTGRWVQGRLPDPVREARLKPRWSRLNPASFDATRLDRQVAIQRLAENLLQVLVAEVSQTP